MKYLRPIFWVLTVCYWVLIGTLTHLPPRQIERVVSFLGIHLDDKLEHLLAYAALALLLALTLWLTFPRKWWLIWSVLLILMAYGAIDEQTQKLVGRDCELDDWIADAVGAMAGILPVAILQHFAGRRHRRARQAILDEPLPAPGDMLGSELEAALQTYDAPEVIADPPADNVTPRKTIRSRIRE